MKLSKARKQEEDGEGVGSIIIFCFVLRGVDTSDRCSTSEPWLQPGVAFLNLFFKVTDKSHLK